MKKSSKIIKGKIKKQISFSRLPEWKQRMAIAKDVLQQLKLKRFHATPGSYLELYEITNDHTYDSQVNKLIASDAITCNVCAKGAMFMSHVMKTNHCTVEQANDVSALYDIPKRLKMFSESQLNLIETAFEQKVVFTDDETLIQRGMKTELAEKAINFSNSPDATDIMMAIMKNIIKNKGTFKP